MNLRSNGIISIVRGLIFFSLVVHGAIYYLVLRKDGMIDFKTAFSFSGTIAFVVIILLYNFSRYLISFDITDLGIKIVYAGFLFKKRIEIKKDKIFELQIKKSRSTIIEIILKDSEHIQLNTHCLTELDENWEKPKFNEYMVSDKNGINNHIIAYNIAKKLQVPLKSEFIIQ